MPQPIPKDPARAERKLSKAERKEAKRKKFAAARAAAGLPPPPAPPKNGHAPDSSAE